MSTKSSVKSFFKSFGYAFSGIRQCVWSERNMRFHLGAALAALCLSLIAKLSAAENALLFVIIGAVLALEAVNTAIERAVDLSSRGEYSKLAKQSKDIAAAAVLFMAFAAIFAGCELFFTHGRFKVIIAFFKDNLWSDIVGILFISIWLLWVFKCDLSELDEE